MKKINIGQMQRTIPILFLDGSQSYAAATGNNAAWICCSENPRPLIGRTGRRSMTKGYIVKCRYCKRCYFVVPEDRDQGRALKVQQVNDII